jgi:signal transduction histidine kinase
VLGNLVSNALQYGSIRQPVKVTLDGDAEALAF